jgi:dTDP-4-amino-4,6-dideoxygalactose transaminase
MNIPFLDLKRINAAYRDELVLAATRVIDSGWYVQGEELRNFEREFAAFCKTRHCIGTGNGLDALTLTLRAWKEMGKLTDGDGVIVPGNTFIASILAIIQAGLRPLLVEPDPWTYNIDPNRVRELLETGRIPGGSGRIRTSRIRCIMPVHLYGRLAPMAEIMEIAAQSGILVLEDAAQAHGAGQSTNRAGSIGHGAGFSFYPGKNLGALGDGGAVTTDDDELAEVVRALGNYGSRQKYVHDLPGTNSRLDELQAAMLRLKLQRMEDEIEHRRKLAAVYLSRISNPQVILPHIDAPERHVWHLFVIRHSQRDRLQHSLKAAGVHTLIHYPVPPHLSGALSPLGINPGSLPVTEELAGQVLSLPIGGHLSLEDAETVADIVNGLF